MFILIDILVVIARLIAGIILFAPIILSTYVAYRRLTAPLPLTEEPIDFNFQATPELQRAYEDEDWDAYDTLMGEHLRRNPDYEPFSLERISA